MRLFPDDLLLTPVSRWPTTLTGESTRAVLDLPIEPRIPAVTAPPAHPEASIVVVTIDGLVFTRLCLESLLGTRSTIDFEVIVIDNGSSDGTSDYLDELSARNRRLRVQHNARNAGFAAATNAGLAMARGNVLVLLNNDTIPVGQWLPQMVAVLSGNAEIGMLGAVTNRAGNEAEIEVSYRTYGELQRFVDRHREAHSGELFDIRTATMFCAAMRRDVWEAVGPLDERFALGLFEDDDYAMRVRQAGFRVLCAEDLFVHHFGQGSIGRLGPTGEYGELFHANRARWEAKWGAPWRPYERRDKPAYRELIASVRDFVCEAVPPGSTVAVISKGDAELVKLEGRRGWHFPQSEDGTYAGHYPADSGACISQLERLRSKGAQFLVIPSTARWWLEHYAEFGVYLNTQYGARQDETAPATIVALESHTGT